MRRPSRPEPADRPDPIGTPARRAALRLLTAVLQQGKPLEVALDNAFAEVDRPADRALARAIVATVLRRLPDLDALIDSAMPKPLPDDARARMVLRLALAQVLILGTPPHAAIGTALPLVDKGPRRLVHGVLSRLLREEAALPEQPTLPNPYAERWSAAYGAHTAGRIAATLATEPPTDLSFRTAEDATAHAEALEGASLAPAHVRTARRGAIGDWPGFADGAWWVQDLAASLPARLLGDVSGKTVVDLCAAPGGKTLQLAAAGAKVTAVDIAEKRIARLKENLTRTGLKAEVVTADARHWTPPGAIDHVLLDAPCSASGIFRRHPDVLHLKGSRNLAPLLELQAELLDHAAGWLPAHGHLIYCVCSLEPEEGERQVEAFLSRYDNFRLDPIKAEELPAGLEPWHEGWVRTLPSDLPEQGGLDGFFIARLARK
ncbi:RsmB/NOP family class I SAM-dependent RNA methyltransferase [Sphingoaurantiacus capsulatus]|uniref:RsmB/NOP family class I SAM-dependent RNA methyltransferase n=1 Tax=Sphingoaurantiacus capsulatus TaxID=1771310 RepID=A0ABV7XFE0_9SPHN